MANIPTLEKHLKAVGQRRRLKILSHLKRSGATNVSDLARAIKLRVYPTSQHLRTLRNAGIVEFEKQGVMSYYFLSKKQEDIVNLLLKKL